MESTNIRMAAPRKIRHDIGGYIPDAKPYNLRRATVDDASLVKIRVFGNEDEPVLGGIAPYPPIFRAKQSDITHMRGIRVNIR